MQKHDKKGFTIVELVIVIAVIAILAAILVPVISNLINRAHVTKDTQLVRNLNTSLAIDTTTPTHTTMQSALDAVERNGYDVAKINASAMDNEIMWDSVNDVFCYRVVTDGVASIEYIPNSIKGDPLTVDDYRLWVISDTVSDTYSTYYTGNATTINTKKGFDVGTTTSVTAINYTGDTTAQDVVIRTNGGTLTVNAPSDTVKHYGEADKVDVQAIFSASYHENGTVKLIAVKEGHVKLEGDAEVNGIYVYNNTSYKQNGEVDSKDTSFKNVKITVGAGVDVPKLSRSAVQIDDEGTKVCTVVTDQAKDVYLFNEGIYEQIKTVDEGKPITDDSASWADSSANTANTQTAAQQLANEFNGTYENGKIADQTVIVDTGANAGTYTVKFNEDTREFETFTTGETPTKVTEATVVKAVAEVAEVAGEAGKSVEEAEASSALKGSGTQADPFLIYDYETMQKISDFYDLGYYYFEVALDKTDNGKIDCTGWVPVKLHGSFDGKGVKFTNVTAVLFQTVGYNLQNENIVLKNFDATMNVSANGQYGAAALIKNIFNAGVTTFDNVNVHGYLEGFWNMGSFYNYGTANYDDIGCDYEVVFNNCYSDATLVCASGNTIGGLFGHAYEGAGNSFTLRVNNSEYTGQMYLTTTSGKGNKYFGMTSNYSNANNHFFFNGIEDTFDNGNSKNAGAYTNSTKITKVTATKESNGYYVAKQTNVSTIVVTITAQLTAYDTNNVQISNLSGITMTISSTELTELDGSSIKVFDLFNSINISKNASEFDASVSNNTLNIKLESSSNYKSGNIRIQVNQYDANGNIVSAGTVDIATCADATSEWVVK